MGVLFDKEVTKEVNGTQKPFIIVLEKYKQIVTVKNLSVSEGDDCLLEVDFDHDIEDVPADEIADELGRVLLERLEKGLDIQTEDMLIEKE